MTVAVFQGDEIFYVVEFDSRIFLEKEFFSRFKKEQTIRRDIIEDPCDSRPLLPSMRRPQISTT